MKRNIIFVDASFRESGSFLGMHVADTIDNGDNYTLKKKTNAIDSAAAEKCAILYGLMYVRDFMHGKPCVILNDNRSATEDADIIHFAHTLNSKVEWIRREMNKADAPSKLSQTTEEREVLKFRKFRENFEKRYKKEGTLIRNATGEKNLTSPLMKKISNAAYIRSFGTYEQKTKKSIPTGIFSDNVILICKERKIEYKKGLGLKVRTSLLKNKRIRVQGGMVISIK